MTPVTKRYTDAERRDLVAIADERGPAYVSAEFGVKPDTIRQWRKRLGIPSSQNRLDKLNKGQQAQVMEWAVRRVRLANRYGEVAEKALDKADGALDTIALAQFAGIFSNVSIRFADKAQLLSGAATSRTENVETLRGEADEIMRELEEQAR